MMGDGRPTMNGNGLKDRMDEVLSLSEALNELDLLNNAANPRKDVKNDMRLRGMRSATSFTACAPLGWRSTVCESTKTFGTGTLTKENFDDPGLAPVYSSGSGGRTSNKILQPRASKSRISPYYRRKPLNPITGRSSSSCCQLSSHSASPLVNGGSRSNGLLSSYHRPHQVSALPLIFESQQQHPGRLQERPAPFLHEHHVAGLRRKTDDDDSVVMPHGGGAVLTRSKSLEDLRESTKPKLKSLSTDMTGGSVCSFDASALSPRNTRSRLGGDGLNSTFPPFTTLFPRKDFESESDIKKEIDSMSMRIERLDVV